MGFGKAYVVLWLELGLAMSTVSSDLCIFVGDVGDIQSGNYSYIRSRQYLGND